MIQAADLSKNDLPSLEDAQELPIDLCGNYWTPEKPGEFRKMYFVEIKPQKVLCATSPDELIDLDCATFLEKSADGTVQTVTNEDSRSLIAKSSIFIIIKIVNKIVPGYRTNGHRDNSKLK